MRLLQKALTFDDVLLVPAYSNVLPRETVLSTQFTRDLRLNIPFCSAAMDTVTEANLAIALAQEGGIGIIHKNMTAQAQAAEVNKVKRHEAGMVADPITIGPDMIVADVIRLTREHNISGLPVVQGEKVLGMVTSFAQGGVASVTNLEVDNFDKHIQDTMIAGDYISDYKAVKQVVLTKAVCLTRM